MRLAAGFVGQGAGRHTSHVSPWGVPIDIQAAATALGIVFLAELGDKTQLVALGLGARHRLATVLIGMSLGYAVVNLLSVVVGGALGASLPDRPLQIGAGGLFLALGAWTAFRTDDDEAEPEMPSAAPSTRHGAGALLSVASAIMVAELGDKTMLATATLAADGSPASVWVGATVGIIAAGAVGAVAGRAIAQRVPPRAIRLGSAALFAAFGLGLIVQALV